MATCFDEYTARRADHRHRALAFLPVLQRRYASTSSDIVSHGCSNDRTIKVPPCEHMQTHTHTHTLTTHNPLVPSQALQATAKKALETATATQESLLASTSEPTGEPFVTTSLAEAAAPRASQVGALATAILARSSAGEDASATVSSPDERLATLLSHMVQADSALTEFAAAAAARAPPTEEENKEDCEQ